MQRITPIPRFNLYQKRGQPDAYIYLFFHYRLNGTTPERFKATAPNTKVLPEYWDKKKQRAMLNRSDPTRHVQVNSLLDDMARHTVAIYADFNCGHISVEDFGLELAYRMKWRPRPVVEGIRLPTLFEFIPDFIEEKKANPRGTWKVLHTVWGLLQAFAKERYRRPLDFADIDHAFFAAFKTWLYAAPRSHSINYASKVITVIRQFMRDGERRKFHSNRDYEFFSIKKVKTTKLALSFDELERLYRLDLTDTPGIERARDLFLIGCYTGLRFSDFTRIRPEHIETIEGQKVLNLTTQKTTTTVSIPLLPTAEMLLRKYDFTAPSMTNQALNRHLKELGKLGGLNDKMSVTQTTGGKRSDEVMEKWERLSSHVARRSFATNFYREGITPISVLMQIVGHATERQFLQYVAISGKMNAMQFAEIQKGKKEVSHLKKAS